LSLDIVDAKLVMYKLLAQGCMNYLFPASYAWGNFSILAVGIWAVVQRDSLDAIMMFLTGLLLTVLTDIIHVCVFYPSNDYLTDVKRFSIGMAIFSLLLKPASCYFVYQMYRERGGEYAFNIGRMLKGSILYSWIMPEKERSWISYLCAYVGLIS
uniref:Angiotensin II receptor associated protein n=1 Tax=Anser cygnoides TaxID=8845 RepID=A0A8B9DX52_ANSCY